MNVEKGRTYDLTVSRVDLTAKVTSVTPTTVRLKITYEAGYGWKRYAVLAVSPDQITKAVPR